MRTLPAMDIGSDKSLSLVSTLSQEHESPCTKRVAELEARIASLRAELDEAEAELAFEKMRIPAPGDFVRCPLTRFFGRVTKVTPRPSGRPWIEIIPYLGPHLPGHSVMDLFDSWELIDPPTDAAAQTSARLPRIAPFMSATDTVLDSQPDGEEMETSLRQLLSSANRISS